MAQSKMTHELNELAAGYYNNHYLGQKIDPFKWSPYCSFNNFMMVFEYIKKSLQKVRDGEELTTDEKRNLSFFASDLLKMFADTDDDEQDGQQDDENQI